MDVQIDIDAYISNVHELVPKNALRYINCKNKETLTRQYDMYQHCMYFYLLEITSFAFRDPCNVREI